MRTFIAISLVCALFAGVPAMAGVDAHEAKIGSSAHARMGEGIVKKIRKESGRLVLQHGDIPGVMSAMTMSYRLKDASRMDELHVGDHVRFALEKSGDEYVVTELEIVR